MATTLLLKFNIYWFWSKQLYELSEIINDFGLIARIQ